MNIQVTEEITDSRRSVPQLDHQIGFVYYKYMSPTHWKGNEICKVSVEYTWFGETEVSLRWGSGGINNGFTDIEIADAMATAFTRAACRLRQLEDEHIRENTN